MRLIGTSQVKTGNSREIIIFPINVLEWEIKKGIQDNGEEKSIQEHKVTDVLEFNSNNSA